jgi:hypothetical protein
VKELNHPLRLEPIICPNPVDKEYTLARERSVVGDYANKPREILVEFPKTGICSGKEAALENVPSVRFTRFI